MAGKRYDSVYQRPNGCWLYMLRVDGRQKKRCFDPETDAEFPTAKAAYEARERERVKQREGSFTEPSKLTFATWLDDWLAHQETRFLSGEIKPSSFEGAKLSVAAYLKPALGNVPVQSITAARLDRFYGELLRTGGRSGKGLSPKTVKNLASTIHNALELARKRQLVQRNVAKDAHAPKAERDPETLRHWTADQLGGFLTFTAADRLRPVWCLLAVTGMRRGEALALRWSDLTVGGVHVTKGRTSFAGVVREGTPKTKRSRRFVPLDPGTLAVLASWRERQTEERDVAEAAGMWAGGDYLFTDEAGDPLHPSTVSRTFDRLVRASGVERISLHGLRHTAATLALANGVPVEVVSKRLGHASVGITLEIYRHVLVVEEDKAATVLGDLVHGNRHLKAV